MSDAVRDAEKERAHAELAKLEENRPSNGFVDRYICPIETKASHACPTRGKGEALVTTVCPKRRRARKKLF